MIRTSLRYFMAVARVGSIRAASAQLNVAQSAISRQIQALEHHLGAVLLDRLANGVMLTEAGRALYESGRRMEFETETLLSRLGSLSGLQRGHVRIAAIESMIPNVLPAAIGRFRQAHPGVTFSVEATASEHVARLVQDGTVDIGIGLSARLSAEFNLVSSLPEPLMAVAAVGHPLAAQASVTLADLALHPMALAPRPSASRTMFDDACRVAEVRVAPAVETNSVELMQRFAALGQAVALLLRHTVAAAIGDGHLVALGLERRLLAGTIDVFTFRDRVLPAAVGTFIAVLGEELARPAP